MIKGQKLSSAVLAVFVMLSLGGCTTSKAIRTPVPDSPTVEQARNSLETQQLIRWGGDVVSVENKADYTLIEIVDRPLSRYGTPSASNESSGRFYARSKQFIDPENITNRHSITVSGILVDYIQGMIGEYEYLYPVVEINEYKIFSQSTQNYPRSYYYPYWYDPWGPYPYWHGSIRYRHW